MILGVVQARMSSRRLPGKVLMSLQGRPMLARQLERLKRCPSMELVVATSDHPGDDAISVLCREVDVPCHRGSLDDVLDRVYGTASKYSAEHVVRLTGDCPLADPSVIELTIARHLEGTYDYTSNALERTYPDGLDVEVMRFDALREAATYATLPSHREHVTPYLYQQPERFNLGSVKDRVDRSQMRWVVDEPADLAFVRGVYDALYPHHPAFDSEDIYALLERQPTLAQLNTGIDPEEGWRRSLAHDREVSDRREVLDGRASFDALEVVGLGDPEDGS